MNVTMLSENVTLSPEFRKAAYSVAQLISRLSINVWLGLSVIGGIHMYSNGKVRREANRNVCRKPIGSSASLSLSDWGEFSTS